MNQVNLLGRLTRDVELSRGGASGSYGRFTLAVDKGLSKDKKREYEAQGKDTADFINCVAFGTTAEALARYTGKGCRVLVQGSIQVNHSEKDGKRTYYTNVKVLRSEIIDFKEIEKSDLESDDFVPVDDARLPF